MKRKFTNQFSIPDKATDNEKILFKQLKALSDDTRAALDSGITFADNIGSTIKTVVVTSEIEQDLGTTANGSVIGAFILFTAGATVSSFKTRMSIKGTLLVTLTLDMPIANITFALIGA